MSFHCETGWRWSLGDTRRVLYRLPRVVECVAAGSEIWITLNPDMETDET